MFYFRLPTFGEDVLYEKRSHSVELLLCEGKCLFQQVLEQHDNIHDWVSRLHKTLKNLET